MQQQTSQTGVKRCFRQVDCVQSNTNTSSSSSFANLLPPLHKKQRLMCGSTNHLNQQQQQISISNIFINPVPTQHPPSNCVNLNQTQPLNLIHPIQYVLYSNNRQFLFIFLFYFFLKNIQHIINSVAGNKYSFFFIRHFASNYSKSQCCEY